VVTHLTFRVPNHDSPPIWSCPATHNPGSHVDAFSHVFESIFLLQQDNVIHQALLDSWGESGNPCTICMLLTVPPWLTPLQLPMSEPLMPDPSLMHTRIRLLSSETFMTIAAAKPPGLIITSLISPHPTLTAIAFDIS
jgi:hypothetical protein